MIRKFRDEIQAGDYVITYSPELRQYLVGIDQGEYDFMPPEQQVGDYANIRFVEWQGKVSRDDLGQATRSFADDGELLVSDALSHDAIEVFGISGAQPTGGLTAKQRAYMAYHREKVFLGG
jgi:restriction system protein